MATLSKTENMRAGIVTMSSEAASVLTGRCKSRSARYLYKRTSIAARSRKATRDE